jgi:hypothetical protein
MLFSFRAPLSWRLLLHLLATGCLTLSIHQFMLTRVADLIPVYRRTGAEGVLRMPLNGRWESTGELMAYLWWLRLLPGPAAMLLGGLLSALIVGYRRERWTIPLVVLLSQLLVSRLGLYESTAVAQLEAWAQLLVLPVGLRAHFWLAGTLLLALSLLLLLVSLRPAGSAYFRVADGPVVSPSEGPPRHD